MNKKKQRLAAMLLVSLLTVGCAGKVAPERDTAVGPPAAVEEPDSSVTLPADACSIVPTDEHPFGPPDIVPPGEVDTESDAEADVRRSRWARAFA